MCHTAEGSGWTIILGLIRRGGMIGYIGILRRFRLGLLLPPVTGDPLLTGIPRNYGVSLAALLNISSRCPAFLI